MRSATIAFHERAWAEMLSMLDEPLETAAVLLAGCTNNDSRLTLTVNRVVPVPDSAYEARTGKELRISSRGWMPSLRIASDGQWTAIFFHTHPGGSATPSPLDAAVDAQLAPVFQTRLSVPLYASLILAGTPAHPVFSGTVLTGTAPPRPITRLRVAGQNLRLHRAQKSHRDALPDVYDRQVRAFGADGQRVLRDLHVGVVGAGGTGSAVLEQLARLGIGALTLVDHDHITETNITRIHGSALKDVGRPKVELASEQLAAIGLETRLHAVTGNISRREVMRQLTGCDLIFGCTDDHAGRAVLSRLAFWYLIPVIDMGVLIASTDGLVTGIYARLTTATPGEPCLLCRGEFDPARAREEQYSDSERASLEREGYAQGLADRDPAVIAYTTMIASHAVADMLARLFGLGEQPVASKQLLDITRRRIRRLGGRSRDGCYCASPEKWGRGDSDSPLGMTWAA